MTPEAGTFVLSLDTEIAWGTFDHGGLQRYAAHFDGIRGAVQHLLDLLDRYHAPATWAFVGHLLLDRCVREPRGQIHPEVLRPRYSWYPHDWHHLDPGTDVERDPWWYGPDLLRSVLDARVAHEVATHTFSHIVVDDPACSREIFRSQLKACIDVHQRWGLKIDSIIYPRNRIAYLDLLPQLGITSYRGGERRWYDRLPPPASRAVHLADDAVAATPPTYRIQPPGGNMLVNVPASMFYLPRDGIRRRIPMASRVLQAQRGLRRAAERGEVFHLWFHPFNLGSDQRLFGGLEQIYEYATALRAEGRLSFRTMRDVASRGACSGAGV